MSIIKPASPEELAALADLYQVRRDITFLNHGSFGACPRPVFEVYGTWQRELEQQPVEFLRHRVKTLLGEARAALGGLHQHRQETIWRSCPTSRSR